MELIVGSTNSVAKEIGGLFENVDFSGMSSVIDKIGDVSTELSDGEKQFATGLIEEWQEDVISTLEIKGGEMKKFVQFLNLNERPENAYYAESFDKEMHDLYGQAMADKTGTIAMYQQYLDKVQELNDYKRDKLPEKAILGSDASFKETIKADTDHEYGRAVFQLEVTRLQRQVYKLEREWKKELLKKEEIQELLLGAKKFDKGTTKLVNDCKAKSRLAKLNVTINSKDARAALAELMNFKIAL